MDRETIRAEYRRRERFQVGERRYYRVVATGPVGDGPVAESRAEAWRGWERLPGVARYDNAGEAIAATSARMICALRREAAVQADVSRFSGGAGREAWWTATRAASPRMRRHCLGAAPMRRSRQAAHSPGSRWGPRHRTITTTPSPSLRRCSMLATTCRTRPGGYLVGTLPDGRLVVMYPRAERGAPYWVEER